MNEYFILSHQCVELSFQEPVCVFFRNLEVVFVHEVSYLIEVKAFLLQCILIGSQ
jgi:hypothetical protein